MERLTRGRVFPALMVLALVIGLPLQGLATAAQAALPASVDLQVFGECDGCGDEPSRALNCPTLLCPGVGGVHSLSPHREPSQGSVLELWDGDLEVGLSPAPEPHPPRPDIH
jgi:hypothetical protein